MVFEFDGRISRPKKGFAETYRRMHWSTCQWHSVGVVKNWDNLLIVNEISTYVFVRYCRLPRISRYRVVSSQPRELLLDSVRSIFGSIGEVASLRFPRPSTFSRFVTYCCCDKKSPLSEWQAWIPRKNDRFQRSLIENSLLGYEIIWSMLEDEETVTTMSSTYTRRYTCVSLLS